MMSLISTLKYHWLDCALESEADADWFSKCIDVTLLAK